MHLILEENPQLEFKGYRLVEGQPRFLYEVDGRPVSQEMRYDASSKTLTLHFTTSNITEPIRFLFQAIGRLATRPEDAERHPGHLLVHPDKNSRFPSRSPSRSVCSHEPYVSITDSGLLVRPLVLTPHSGQSFLPG